MQISTLAHKKTLELKKHVGLIHSTNKLSLLERKIANALLYNAYENLLTHDDYTIHIPTLCVLIGYNSKDYKTVKQSLVSLISTVLEWNLVDKDKIDEEGIWVASAMLADASINGPICTYSYSKKMRELCYHPDFYGRLNVHVLAMFKSSYGLALYENCTRYQNIAQTPWFNLPIYRKLMGVEEGKYIIFRDFNRRVIIPAVKEVNKHSSICIKPEFKKQGRVVIAIRFLIIKQEEKNLLKQIDEGKNNDNALIGRLKEDYGFSQCQLEKALNTYDEHYILEKMNIIESSLSYKNGKIEYLANYLEKALKENYQAPKSSKKNLEKLRREREEEIEQHKLQQKKICQYRYYQNQQLPGIYKTLSDKEKKIIDKEFDEYISATLYYNAFLKDGLENPLVKDRFADFVRANRPDLLLSLVSFEEYCRVGCNVD